MAGNGWATSGAQLSWTRISIESGKARDVYAVLEFADSLWFHFSRFGAIPDVVCGTMVQVQTPVAKPTGKSVRGLRV
jgi:hypothetical protein